MILSVGALYKDKPDGISSMIDRYSNIFEKKNIRHHTLSIVNEQTDKVIFFVPLIKIILFIVKKKPRILILHGVYNNLFLLVSLFVKFRAVRVFIIPHGQLSKNAPRRPRHHIFLFLLKRLLPKTAIIIFFNQLDGKNSIEIIRKKIFIPNTVNVDRIQQRSWRPIKGALKVCIFGRVDIYQKGIDQTVQTLGRLQEYSKKPVELHIIGVRNRRDTESIRLLPGIAQISNLILHKQVSNAAEKYDHLTHMDCFFQLSRYEGMPVGVLEMLAVGLPGIISFETNIDATILPSCFVINPNDELSAFKWLERQINQNKGDYTERVKRTRLALKEMEENNGIGRQFEQSLSFRNI